MRNIEEFIVELEFSENIHVTVYEGVVGVHENVKEDCGDGEDIEGDHYTFVASTYPVRW